MKQVIVLIGSLLAAISLCDASLEKSHKDKGGSNTNYDQRQVGKYNIHFNIKDVAIIAVSGDELSGGIGDSGSYPEYNYDYEDDELTVSPIIANLGKPTTAKPSLSDTNPVKPSISGLNLASLSTSTETNAVLPSTTKKPTNVVVIHEKPLKVETDSTDTADSSKVKFQPDEIPVQVIVEPLLKPKIKPSQSTTRKLANRQVNSQDEDTEDVRLRPRRAQIAERIRLRRGQAQAQNRLLRNSEGCNRGEVHDGQGGCRTRRSGMSGLLGLFSRFLPEKN